MYKISKLNAHNTNSLDLKPGMTAIRFDDGLTTTAHQCHIHVPQKFNMRCVIPFHPSFRNCCTCKSSYIGKSPSPNYPTEDNPVTLGLRSGDMDDQGMSLQKAQSRVCDMRSRTILHHAHTPVMSKSLRFVKTLLLACKHSHNTKITEEKKTFHIEEA